MVVPSQENAIQQLGTIGYYRLSSYWFHMEINSEDTIDDRTHLFKPGTDFESVVNLYVFDQKLRILVMEAIERLEIAMRAKWAYYLSESNGSHAHCNSECFLQQDEHMKSLSSLFLEVDRAKDNSCEIKHYLGKYSEPILPPIWTIVGCMSFGELRRWIKNTKEVKVKRLIAKDILGTPNIDLFDGITRQLSTVRNMCAHHGRLWDQRFITKMPYIKTHLKAPMVAYTKNVQRGQQSAQETADNKMYNTILILGHLMVHLSPSSTWPSRVASLVRESLNEDQLKVMGFPADWEDLAFWK